MLTWRRNAEELAALAGGAPSMRCLHCFGDLALAEGLESGAHRRCAEAAAAYSAKIRAERERLALELARRVAAGVSGEELFAAALGELAQWRAGERRRSGEGRLCGGFKDASAMC